MNSIEKIKVILKYFTNLSYVNQISKKCPIIIGGCGRSGTTLLLSILGSHPNIQAIKDETGLFLKQNMKDNISLKTKYYYLINCWNIKKLQHIDGLRKHPKISKT